MMQTKSSPIELDIALRALKRGGFVLLHDSLGRENEVDMVVAAELISPEHVGIMRRNAGGLVCLALGREVAEKLGLVAMREILLLAAREHPVLKSLDEENAPYGGKSAFSITVNHKRTFTGVTDRDRAVTISELAKIANLAMNGDDPQDLFASEFKSPGHVHLLLESKGALAERRGHTELSVYLCRRAGVAPAAAICEMLDAKTHNALSVDDAKKYADAHSVPLLEGQRLVEDFLERNHS
jgi:3,4-dihydroxy 2-butanone 4-phosphate synthase